MDLMICFLNINNHAVENHDFVFWPTIPKKMIMLKSRFFLVKNDFKTANRFFSTQRKEKCHRLNIDLFSDSSNRRSQWQAY